MHGRLRRCYHSASPVSASDHDRSPRGRTAGEERTIGEDAYGVGGALENSGMVLSEMQRSWLP